MAILSRFPGMGGVPLGYWIFAGVCPAVVSYPIVHKLVMQSERLVRLNNDLKQAHRALERIAESDQLTLTLNRHGFLRHIEHKPPSEGGWLLLLDVDHFKSINDNHGHETGDRALQAIAQVLQQSVRSSDAIGRMGGEEFAIYLAHANKELAVKIAERLRSQVEKMPVISSNGTIVFTTISIGVAEVYQATDIRAQLHRADMAMYKAKHDGRNRVMIAA